MSAICGANCEECRMKNDCRGCRATCGRPFGGTCVAAEYIKEGSIEKYNEFKRVLLNEINTLLMENGIPQAERLYELPGLSVNLPYPVPSGKAVRLLDDRKVYLGSQIEFADLGVCYGVVADTTFILICSYSVDGSQPELIIFKKR
ncbi:MAG: DUF3795 domain-containing protein [Clostridia bacterium]|nr:DUF3795 domain-containing protein [Clostridia bacterium]